MKRLAKSFLGILLLVSIVMTSFTFAQVEVKAAGEYAAWDAVFDPEYYTTNNAEAKAFAGGDVEKLWSYFVKVGIPRGDQASAEFNVFIYIKNYPELAESLGGDLAQYYVHYQNIGKAAGYNAATLNTTNAKNKADNTAYPEGYIFIGGSNAHKLQTAASALKIKKTDRIEGFESCIFHATNEKAAFQSGNLFFVYDGADYNTGKEYIYSNENGENGSGVKMIHSIMSSNPSIKHWNIIAMHGKSSELNDADTMDYYISSYSNWINNEFKDADVYAVSMGKANATFNAKLKSTFGNKYIDIDTDYNTLTANETKTALVELLTKVRQLRVSSYSPNEVGFIILSECHSDILLWSIPYYLEDNSITTIVPKVNVVPLSSKSHGYPNYWGGGVTVNFEGLDYEADDVINGAMKEHNNVKFWYIVYFAGSNYVRNLGVKGAGKYVKSNLDSIANKTYYADNTIALMTTPPMYNRGPAVARTVEEYDDFELEHMKSIGYEDYAFDTREAFSEYIDGKKLKRVEFKGYRYGSSGDGLHFYGKQYWTVAAEAVNTIYNQTRGE